MTAYWKKWLKTKYTHTWLDPPCAPIECWLRVTEENLDFFEWDKNHDGIVTKKEIKEMTFIDPGTESSFNLLSDKRFTYPYYCGLILEQAPARVISIFNF